MFSNKRKIAIDPQLHDRAAQRAADLGYGSLAEFVEHVLEKELGAVDDPQSRDRILQKMKGLGYLQ
jgi:hypothetical protein